MNVYTVFIQTDYFDVCFLVSADNKKQAMDTVINDSDDEFEILADMAEDLLTDDNLDYHVDIEPELSFNGNEPTIINYHNVYL
jgi:hypothetical protein